MNPRRGKRGTTTAIHMWKTFSRKFANDLNCVVTWTGTSCKLGAWEAGVVGEMHMALTMGQYRTVVTTEENSAGAERGFL